MPCGPSGAPPPARPPRRRGAGGGAKRPDPPRVAPLAGPRSPGPPPKSPQGGACVRRGAHAARRPRRPREACPAFAGASRQGDAGAPCRMRGIPAAAPSRRAGSQLGPDDGHLRWRNAQRRRARYCSGNAGSVAVAPRLSASIACALEIRGAYAVSVVSSDTSLTHSKSGLHARVRPKQINWGTMARRRWCGKRRRRRPGT